MRAERKTTPLSCSLGCLRARAVVEWRAIKKLSPASPPNATRDSKQLVETFFIMDARSRLLRGP